MILHRINCIGIAYITFTLGIIHGESSDVQSPVAKEESPIPDVSKINRAMPVSSVTREIILSGNLGDSDFKEIGLFPIALVSSNKNAENNSDLAAVLRNYKNSAKVEDTSLLQQFVDGHPESKWNIAMLANIAQIDFNSARFEEALDAWGKIWKIGKNEKDPEVKAVVDLAVGEFARLNYRVGRTKEVESILQETKGRQFVGPATELITGAKEALWLMKNRPGKGFRCGPFAVATLFGLQNPKASLPDALENAQSTSNGTSLTQLRKLAADAGMDYQMAFREKGASIIIPSIINWKIGHWAALTEDKGDVVSAVDPVFGRQFWVKHDALDKENSGYYLVPGGDLPTGWRSVDEEEGDKVWGKGGTFVTDPDSTTPDDEKCPRCGDSHGMAVANAHLSVVSLNIVDTPLFYSPPRGPAFEFRLTYNQRDSNQPAVFTSTNFGPKWTCDWISCIIDNPGSNGAAVLLYAAGGGGETFLNLTASYANTIATYQISPKTQSLLSRDASGVYTLQRKDGTIETFAKSDGATSYPRRLYRTQITDPQGNTISFHYDSLSRIDWVVDQLGQVTNLYYNLSGDNKKLTQITDPFGRSAFLGYDTNGTGAKLNRITDMAGMVSSFQYSTTQAADFISKMTTPYGDSLFTYAESGSLATRVRWLQLTDPMGGTERIEYNESDALGIPDQVPIGEVPYPNGASGTVVWNFYMNARNTYYWSKKALAKSASDYATITGAPPLNYSYARVYHWTHGDGQYMHDGQSHPGLLSDVASGVIDSIKDPLESRVWYHYPGDSKSNSGMSNRPDRIMRVLDPSDRVHTTQIYQLDDGVSSWDWRTLRKATDPLGRTTTYKYASNGVDLLGIYQQRPGGASVDAFSVQADALTIFDEYNALHQPQKVTDASGNVTRYTYNSYGQILTRKVTRNSVVEQTTWNYTGDYLTNITGPIAGSGVSFTYDQYGRVRTVTDSEGYKVIYAYDDLNRLRMTTYPDGSYTQTLYSRLDPEWLRDRLGRWTHTEYNAAGLLKKVTDPEGRQTTYNRCSCGALDSIVDANGNSTEFETDIQGRVQYKKFGGVLALTNNYDLGGRLKSVLDARGQTKGFDYYLDDALKNVTYTNEISPTADVSFTYDTYYLRPISMADGIGSTSYAYKAVGTMGANRIDKIDGPLANDDIVYSYDELGRAVGISINGTGASAIYDALGRVTNVTNPLGAFIYSYVNQTRRVSSVSRPGGSSIAYNYFPNSGDQRLEEIKNLGPSSSALSKFNYKYNAVGEITKWTQQVGSAGSQYYDLSYDKADQLRNAYWKTTSTDAMVTSYQYRYDVGGNRKSEQVNDTFTPAGYNSLNQLKTLNGGNEMPVSGSLDEPGTLKVNGQWVALTSGNQFSVTIPTTPGANSVPLVATDGSGNTTSKTLQFTVPANAVTLLYDANGNLTDDGEKTYEWDAADRLFAINYTGTSNRTQFAYDGWGQRAKILEGTVTGGTFTAASTKKFVWVNRMPAEERDGNNAVTKRFYPEGEQIGGTAYLFNKDHLGSVREMTNLAGTVQARYAYDPYGRRTKLSGSMEADFGFTGFYYHAPSSLQFALYRAYDANKGRWISRDPMGEIGGINLYSYCTNNTINLRDPDGREAIEATILGVVGFVQGGVNGETNGSGFWRGAVSEGLGGIAGGLIGDPIAGGAVAGAITSLVQEGFDAVTGCNGGFNPGEVAKGLAVGAATGGLFKNILPKNSELDLPGNFKASTANVLTGVNTQTLINAGENEGWF